eukprot:PhM_4_TR1313/c1_g2_i1/m.2574
MFSLLLRLQVLVNKGEVLIAVALVNDLLVHGHSVVRAGSAQTNTAGGVLRQTGVLKHQSGREAALVPVRAGDVGQHIGARVVLLRRPALAGGLVKDRGEHLLVDAQSRAELHALGHCEHRLCKHQIVGQLARLTSANIATLKHIRRHGGEDILGLLEVLAANHERERAVSSTVDAAGNGGVEENTLRLCNLSGDLRRDVVIHGAAVNEGRTLSDERQHLLKHFLHNLAVREHRNHNLSVLKCIGNARASDEAITRSLCDGLGNALADGVIDADGVGVVLEEVGDHAAAHLAEADEGNAVVAGESATKHCCLFF